MAIFSRREIQRRIGKASSLLTRPQLESLVGRLNQIGRASVEAEWELIWITSLAQVGSVSHEPRLVGGSRHPDVYFRSGTVEFIADITAISDVGYDDENPIDEFQEELNKLYFKHGLFGGFSLVIESELEGPKYRDRRVRLFLPKRKDIPSFIRDNFDSFLRNVAATPAKPHSHVVAVPDGGNIKLSYDPNQRPYNHGASHLSYNIPYSLRRNPITNTLKGKKRQLAKSGWTGMSGVILCDGDCRTLTTQLNDGSTLTLDQIVHDFLRQNQSVNFVLTIGIKTKHNHYGNPQKTLSIKARIFTQSSLNKNEEKALIRVFSDAIAGFPHLERDASHAVWLANMTRPLHVNRETFCRGLQMTMGNKTQTTEIKLSARALAAVLGGELDIEAFRKSYQIPPSTSGRGFDVFQSLVREGRTIIEAKIESLPEKDDDLIVLRFGLPDAAASKFMMPKDTHDNDMQDS